MDEQKNNTAAGGNGREVNLLALRLAVSAYLCYLGFDLLRTFLVGASSFSAAAWGFGLGFMAAGLGFGVYSFLRYRRRAARKKADAEETGKTPDEES